MKSAQAPPACRFMSYLVWGSGSCGRAPSPSARQSAPVNTQSPTGIAVALLASMPRMRACACGERSITAQAWPSTLKSSLKRPRPGMGRASSVRRRGVSMKRKLISPGRGFWSRSVVVGGGSRRFYTIFISNHMPTSWAYQGPFVLREGHPAAGTQVLPSPAFAGMRGVSMRLLSRQGNRAATLALSPQRLGEAELVAVRVGQMEEALAPFGIARRRVRAIAGRDHARVQRVDVGMVEDDASPPRPRSLGRLGDQIEIARSSPKARKRGVAAPVDHLKSQHAIEADRARHVVGGERDGADIFDRRAHPISGARSLGRSLGLRGDSPVRLTTIAPIVPPPHVVDHGIRPLAFHLELGDQPLLRRHRHALVFASGVYADGEFEHHGGLFPLSSVGSGARLGLLELREPHL